MEFQRAVAWFGVATLMAGCATASKEISSTYVSPVQYQPYDCQQLSAESQRIHGRVSQLGARLDEAASNDKAITGVGMILFWPALFALGGTKQQEADYARLMGEYDAVHQAAIAKKCDMPSPPVIAANQKDVPIAGSVKPMSDNESKN